MLKFARNIFVGIFAIILCAVAFTYAYDRVLTSTSGEEKGGVDSYLESRAYQEFPEVTKDTLSEGTFQSDYEQYVSDMVPFRDEILVANATLQRQSIALGADMFGYDVYPTFYGSDRAYDKSLDIVNEMPYRQTVDYTESLEKSAEWINGFAERHPDLSVTVSYPPRYSVSAANPVSELIPDPIDAEYMDEHFLNKLNDRVNAFNVEEEITPDFTEDYFKTDHHWQATYSYEVYKYVLSRMYPEATPVVVQDVITWDEQPFYGSNARKGLCLQPGTDIVNDVVYEESDVKVIIDGETSGLGAVRHIDEFESDDTIRDVYSSKYMEYFHVNSPTMTLVNEDMSEGKTLLLIGDSYSNSTERFYAENYKTVYVIDPRSYRGTLDSFCEKRNIDDVLMFVNAGVILEDGMGDFLSADK